MKKFPKISSILSESERRSSGIVVVTNLFKSDLGSAKLESFAIMNLMTSMPALDTNNGIKKVFLNINFFLL